MSVNLTLKDLFHQACKEADLEKIKCCLSLGYDVNYCDENYQPGKKFGPFPRFNISSHVQPFLFFKPALLPAQGRFTKNDMFLKIEMRMSKGL